jgi:YidC/Oxa1 family membrane protein insertase
MDKRTFLALLLTALVIVVTPLLFPGARRQPTPPTRGAGVDTTKAVEAPAQGATTSVRPAQTTAQPPAPASHVVAETTTVRDGVARFIMSSAGAAPVAVALDDSVHRNLKPGAKGGGVTIAPPRGQLLHYRLVLASDTIALDTIAFTRDETGSTLKYTSSGAHPITIAYDFAPRGYLAHVRGTVGGTPTSGQLLVTLPNALRSSEADTVDDIRHFAYAYKPNRDDVQNVSFDKLDSVARTDSGPLRWVALRNKYFLVAAISPSTASDFAALHLRGAPRVNKLATTAEAVAVAPVRDGNFALDLYAGPQDWSQLHALGNDLENVHPYAGWLHGVVQPFSTIVMRILLWMKATLRVNYGWVLILFGVLVRLLLWPLNQSAMRSSIKMQRLQPELMELQKRYKNDPEKQRDAMVKLYQEHGMSPLSPMMGCLPMLLPMPVLFALYFVFTNTIEFRGNSFLWLPDLALRDPFYITPIFMGLSMLVLSWIGMRGVPPNPQSKMMAYMMPAMMTVMFLGFPSGLNLYYAVQNVAAMPQQLLLSKERQKAAPTAARVATPPSGKRNIG